MSELNNQYKVKMFMKYVTDILVTLNGKHNLAR